VHRSSGNASKISSIHVCVGRGSAQQSNKRRPRRSSCNLWCSTCSEYPWVSRFRPQRTDLPCGAYYVLAFIKNEIQSPFRTSISGSWLNKKILSLRPRFLEPCWICQGPKASRLGNYDFSLQQERRDTVSSAFFFSACQTSKYTAIHLQSSGEDLPVQAIFLSRSTTTTTKPGKDTDRRMAVTLMSLMSLYFSPSCWVFH
jgi:hypothetical protein